MITDSITIVSGLPRSGTSMMMQMLQAGGIPILTDNVRQADDDNPRGYYEFEPVKRTKQDPSWLNAANGKAVKMVYLLLRDLPADYRYRVIFMQRPLPEVIASQKSMLASSGQAGTSLDDGKLENLFAREQQEIAQWLSRQPNFSVLNVAYTEVLQDHAQQVEILNSFLGGGLNTTAMRAAVCPDLYRQKG